MSTGRSQKSRETALEINFRVEMRAQGLRGYRVQHQIRLPKWGRKHQHTTPDVAFVGRKIAIYLDGCYWHGCPRCYRETRTNSGEWRVKRAKTRARDERHSRALVVEGWRVFRLWECQDIPAGVRAVKAILETDPPPGVYGLPT